MTQFEEDFFFDSRAVPERSSLLEAGKEYEGIIIRAALKTVSTGRLVEVGVDIQGKGITMGMWVDHSNEKAVLIGAQNLRDCYISAFGRDVKAPISQLVNKVVRVSLKKGVPNPKDGKQYLEIDRWLPTGKVPIQKQVPVVAPEDVPF